MSFAIKYFSKLIFVRKNWLNDLKLDASSPWRLVELIEINAIFKKELKAFEGASENDEVVEI